MAWTAIYDHTFDSADGNTWTWEIQKDTTPGSTPLDASGRSFIRTTYSSRSDYGLMPSETTLTFYDTTGGAVLNEIVSNLQADAENLRLVLKDGSVTKWIGFLDVGSISVRADDPQYRFTLRAHCGLGKMKDHLYVASTDPYVLKEGRVTLKALLAELLAYTGHELDFWTSGWWYPYNGTAELAATDNPLDNIYVERRVFREKAEKEDGVDNPISVSAVIDALCARFGLRIAQSFGAWWVVQVDQLYNASARYWWYNAAGTLNSTQVLTHGIAVPSDVDRSPATLSLVAPINAGRVNFHHGYPEYLRNPTFDPRGFIYSLADFGWSVSGLTSPYSPGDGDLAIKIPSIQTYHTTNPLPDENDNQGTGAGSWDAVIQAGITANTTGIVYQTTETIPAGTVLKIQASCWPLFDAASGAIDGFRTVNKLRATAQVKLSDGVAPAQYLKRDGTWTTDVWWMPFPVGANFWQEIVFQETGTVGTPLQGAVTLTLGPLFEESANVYNSAQRYVVDDIVWDNASVLSYLDDGTFGAETTSTVNYVTGGREKPRTSAVDVFFGDGPTAHHDTRLTWDSAGATRTTTWKEGNITGGDPGDTLDELHSRVILRAGNKVRTKYSETYVDVGSTVATPINAIQRGGSRYVPETLTIDWQDNSYTGTFVQALQTGFTDDLETGIYSGRGSGLGALGTGGSVGFALTQLQQTFLSEMSKRITVTTAEIPPGSGTASISVEAIEQPLLHDGDLIVIIAPDLSFQVVEVGADQVAGATSIAIVDPTDHVSNFDFPSRIGYPASIFFTEDQLLTLARLGEQGFGVTVLGQPLGEVDGTYTVAGGPYTTLDVTEWVATLRPGDTFFLPNGTELQTDTVDGTASRGATQIDIESASFDANPGDLIYGAGQVQRTEFLVTDGKITAYIERAGEKIGQANGDQSGTTINVHGPTGSGGITDDLFVGDYVIIHRAATGAVVKRKLSASAAAGATSLSFTASVDVTDDDPIFPSILSGMRIDADGIIFKETHLYSSNFDGTIDASGNITAPGTAGWAISSTGESVFNDVVIRGSLDVGQIIGDLTINGGSIQVGSAVTIDGGGIDIAVTSGTAYETAKALFFDTYGTISYLIPGTGQATYDFNILSDSGAAATAYVNIAAQDTGGSATLSIGSDGTLTFNGSGVPWMTNNLDSTLGASGDYTGFVTTRTAAEAIAAADLCTLDGNGEVIKTAATAAETTNGFLLMAPAAVSAAASGTFLLPGGFIRHDNLGTGLVNEAMYVSETAGALTDTAPTIARLVGHWSDANTFYFYPSPAAHAGSEISGVGRAIFGGGLVVGVSDVIDYVTIASTGNATDFGNLTAGRYGLAACASVVRGLFGGGTTGSASNVIDYVTIASTGNATDFGDLTTAIRFLAACSSSTRGLFGGGEVTNVIDYVTLDSAGNAIDFGDLTVARYWLAACASPTRGLFGGGFTGSTSNVIDYVTIASTGNATDFGDLSGGRAYVSSCSSSTRGLFGGGSTNSTIIEYVTIASTGNVTDFGDLTVGRQKLTAASSETRALFAGGSVAGLSNVIDYVEIDTTANATDFGDLTEAREYLAGCSDVHGGL